MAGWSVGEEFRRPFTRETVVVNFADVVAGSASGIYGDPRRFFQLTYPTNAMRAILQNVRDRLSGRGGQGVFVLRSGFGGGKTHLLATLYYLLARPEAARGTEFEQYVPGVDVKVCAADLSRADPWMEALWGWLGRCLGRYDLVRIYDDERRPPGDLGPLFEGLPPVAMLLDEVGEHLSKVWAASRFDVEKRRAYAEAIRSFFFTLSTSLRDRDVLVVSVPDESVKFDHPEVYGSIGAVVEVLRRVGVEFAPLGGLHEVYEVLRRRVFAEVDGRARDRAAGKVGELVARWPGGFAEWFTAEEVARAYPFHPGLIRVLYERTSSLPNFQRTRDLIYVLAHAAVNAERRGSELVNVRDLDLLGELKTFFTDSLGYANYRSIIDHDVRRAKELSEDHYAVAVAVYLHSLSAAEPRRTGAGRALVRGYVALPSDVDPSKYDKAVEELLQESWYMDTDGSRVWISGQPNINKVIEDKARLVPEGEALKLLEDEAEYLARQVRLKGVEVRLFSSWDEVKDERRFAMYVASPKLETSCDSAVEKIGGRIFAYQNSAMFLLHGGTAEAMYYARYVKACDELAKGIPQEQRGRFEEACNAKKYSFYLNFYRAYSCLIYPTEAGWALRDLRFEEPSARGDRARAELARALAGALARELEGKYMESPHAEFLYDVYISRRAAEEVELHMFVEDFYRDPTLPMVPSPEEAVREVASRLAEEGKVVLSCGDTYYWPEGLRRLADAEGPEAEEARRLLSCRPENAIKLLKRPPEDVVKALERLGARERPPAERCEEGTWPLEAAEGVEPYAISIEGEKLADFKNLLSVLETHRPKAVHMEAELRGGDFEVKVSARGIGSARRMLGTLSGLEGSFRGSARVEGEIDLGELRGLLGGYRGVKVSVVGRRCQ